MNRLPLPQFAWFLAALATPLAAADPVLHPAGENCLSRIKDRS